MGVHAGAAAYLDAASAAPLHPVAREALLAALGDGWADPGRLYAQARRARQLADAARGAVAVPLVVDAAQSAGRVPVPPGWSVLTASARKWGGPPGVGLLVVRKGTRWLSPYPGEDRHSPGAEGEPGLPAVVAAAASL